MSEPLLVLANRAAGSLLRRGSAASLEAYARQAGLEVEVVFTRSAAHLRRILRERVVGRRARVAAAGGDGTIRSAVQELAGTGVVLGILPQGTANNFATALRLPRDLPSAFRVIAEGEVCAVSLGRADDEYFTESAGAGLFAEGLALTRGTHRPSALLRGAFLLLRTLLFGQVYRFGLEIDGKMQVEDALNITVANSFCVGYNLPIAPYARLTDEELDVVIIGPLSRSELLPYFQAIRTQTHLQLPKVRALRAREVVLHSRGGALVHVDDRSFRRTPVTVRLVPEALRVLVERL